MADFFKGLAGGFGTGLQFGSAMQAREERERQLQMRDALAQEAGRYGVTEGAYGPGLQENIQQLEGLKAQDPAQAAAYDQAIGELTRRQGMTAPDYSVASGPTNFATRQEARQAAAPMRAEGLAGVYRQFGDVTKADELESRALEQQRAAAAEQRAVSAEGRAQQQFATGQTLTGLQINKAAREESANKRVDDFSAFAAERPEASVAELKDAAFKQFKFSPKQWEDVVTTRLNIDKADLATFKAGIQKKLQGKSLTQLGTLYNTDSDFDDKTDLAIVPGKGGAVTLNFIDKASGKVTGSQTFKNEALATEYLNKQATEPETIGSWMMNLRKAETGIEADQSAIRLRNAQAGEVGKSAVEKNLATLQRLGIAVSPEDVRAMAGIKQDKLSPEAAARLEVITASVKGNDSPKALAEAQAEITNLFKGEALNKRNATIVKGLQTANTKNDLPAAIKQLRDAGVGDETIVGLARQAGVTLPANFAPAAPPAAPAAAPVSPRTGLSTGAQQQQQQYGPLTPRATIEADARAGVPAAIAYLRQQAEYARNLELARTENAMRAMQGE